MSEPYQDHLNWLAGENEPDDVPDVDDVVRAADELDQFRAVKPGFYICWHSADGKLRMTDEPFDNERMAEFYAYCVVGRDAWVVREGSQAA